MMWGSILALWGTAAIVATSSRSLGINKASVQILAFLRCSLHMLSQTCSLSIMCEDTVHQIGSPKQIHGLPWILWAAQECFSCLLHNLVEKRPC